MGKIFITSSEPIAPRTPATGPIFGKNTEIKTGNIKMAKFSPKRIALESVVFFLKISNKIYCLYTPNIKQLQANN